MKGRERGKECVQNVWREWNKGGRESGRKWKKEERKSQRGREEENRAEKRGKR